MDLRRVCDSLLGPSVDDSCRVFLIDQRWNERLLHVQDTRLSEQIKKRCQLSRECIRNVMRILSRETFMWEEIDVPKEVHIEDLVPLIKAIPRCAFQTNSGVVHEDSNLVKRERTTTIVRLHVQHDAEQGSV